MEIIIKDIIVVVFLGMGYLYGDTFSYLDLPVHSYVVEISYFMNGEVVTNKFLKIGKESYLSIEKDEILNRKFMERETVTGNVTQAYLVIDDKTYYEYNFEQGKFNLVNSSFLKNLRIHRVNLICVSKEKQFCQLFGMEFSEKYFDMETGYETFSFIINYEDNNSGNVKNIRFTMFFYDISFEKVCEILEEEDIYLDASLKGRIKKEF